VSKPSRPARFVSVEGGLFSLTAPVSDPGGNHPRTENPLTRRLLMVTFTILVLGLTTSLSPASANLWPDRGWASLAKKPRPVKPTATATSSPTPTAPAGSTPTTTTPVPKLASFVRVMTDEFNGTALDTTKWTPYSGKLSSSPGCNEPDNLQVANGVLTMLFAYQSAGVCGANWYHGSMMVKREYGYNEQAVTLRFRVLNNDPVNTRAHRILPMRWPSASVSGGSTPAWYNGESDYCEGSSLSGCTTFLHHTSSSQQVASPHTFDLTQWHVLRAVQSAGNDVSIYIDDMTTPRWHYDGTTVTVPDVFKRTVLQQECGSSCPTDRADWERIEIDWITIDNLGGA
jgi:hypothetical protein